MTTDSILYKIIDFPRELLHFIFYVVFLFSLFCVTKPLAWIVDRLSTDNDLKFLDGEE
jgi:hypothetical protein